MALYHTYSDGELLVFLQNDDEKAFGEIYDRYWEKLFAIAWHYSKQRHLAEEIVQDIFMSLWDRRSAVSIESLPDYLATAVKFSVFASLKKELNHRRLLKQVPVISSTSAEAPIHARFLKDYIHDRVKALPEQCRIVYIYSREEQLTVPEIAERMNLAPKTVENHLGRALRIIRGEVGEVWIFIVVALNSLF